jgi:4-amino-4-deoxy-L-arabinose transferase-like glycosyltransferase
MPLLLPLAAFGIFFKILLERGVDWRRSFLGAAAFWGGCVAMITETLSIPRLLTAGMVAIFWLLICVASLIGLVLLRRRRPSRVENFEPEQSGFVGAARDRVLIALVIGTGLIVLLVGITALVAAPSTWDAMEYHLPRTVMWMNNHSVRLYTTPDYYQLIYGPWAEFTMMDFNMLASGDRFVNLVEVFSYAGSLVGVSLIAKLLGAGFRAQVLAVVVCASIPEGILEASGPMNTYVVTFWLTATVAFMLSWNREPGWFNTICVGLTAGLALLTKGTAYFYLPFLVLACWWLGSVSTRILFLKRSAVFALMILALNAPQFLRCYELSGSPLGAAYPGEEADVLNTIEGPSLRGTLANMIRMLSLHFGTPSPSLNSHLEKMLRVGIRTIGADPDDPHALWGGYKFEMHKSSLSEIHAANPLHLVLLLIAFGFVLWNWKRDKRDALFWYALGLVAAFLFFCASLRWNMWMTRQQLPWFVLASPLIGLLLERYWSPKVQVAVAVVLLAFGCVFAVANRTRSLVPSKRLASVYQPRAVQYFSDQHETVADTYIAAAEAINRMNCANIAIDCYVGSPTHPHHSPNSFFVYPLMALIHADGRTRTVWYTGVHNSTTQYSHHQTPPGAVVCMGGAEVPEKWAEYRAIGGRASVFGDIVIFSAWGAIPNSGPGFSGVRQGFQGSRNARSQLKNGAPATEE